MIAGVLLIPTDLGLFGLGLVLAGAYILLGHTEKTIDSQCPECGHRQTLALRQGEESTHDQAET
jgi:hypothetical protein